MFIRLSYCTFVRPTESFVHIANISLMKQCTYNCVTKYWLMFIRYEWRDIHTILSEVISCLAISQEDVCDFTIEYLDFIEQLIDAGYLDYREDNKDDVCPVNNVTTQFFRQQFLLTTLSLEITDGCNERCIHCYIPESIKAKKQSVSFDNFCKTVNSFILAGGKTVRLTGGEVMTHPYWKNMVLYCRRNNLNVEMLSNLLLSSDENLSFIKDNISIIQVSLYSSKSSVHDYITNRKGSFDSTMRGVKYLIMHGVNVVLAVPLMKSNFMDIISVIDLSKSLKTSIIVEPLIWSRLDGSKDNLAERLSVKEIANVLERIADYDFDLFVRLFVHCDLNDNEPNYDFLSYLLSPVCDIGKTKLCINSSGEVIPCVGWKNNVLSSNESDLSKIWSSENMNSLRWTCEYHFRKCVACAASNYCVRCMKRNEFEVNNKFKIDDALCKLAFAIKRIYESKINSK